MLNPNKNTGNEFYNFGKDFLARPCTFIDC